MVRTTSLGMVTPGTYDAGSGTTLVSATEEMREKRTASVVVSAWGRSPGSSAGCSSVCEWTSRVGVSTRTVMWRRTSIPGSKTASWCTT